MLLAATSSPVLDSTSNVNAAIAPDREIITVDSPQAPEWKQSWDAAREYARTGDFAKSAASYQELFARKPQIEEAKWEYCKVLFELKEYDAVSTILEGLIEISPHRYDYQTLAGHVALEKQDYERAVSYLGQVYSQQPEGSNGVALLAGLIEGLQGLGKKHLAYPLMEQLYQRQNDSVELLQDLARYSRELGRQEKARDYYATLVAKFRVSEEILFEAAEVFDVAGMEEKALSLWEEYLNRKGDYLPYRLKIIDYYLSHKENNQALPHILYVIENHPDSHHDLLLQAATIYRQQARRPDKALQYFERYLVLYPNRGDIQGKIQKVRDEVASSLMAIVENNGAEPLWRDLAHLTANPGEIFKVMAQRLEEKNKVDALIEVLSVLQEHTTDQDQLAWRISKLYAARKKYSLALDYARKVKVRQRKGLEYYRFKGWLEEQVGHDQEALRSYRVALELDPTDLRLRRSALGLAGRAGFVADLEAFYDVVRTEQINKKNLATHLAYLEGLRLNGFFTRAQRLYESFDQQDLSKEERFHLHMHQAETLHQERKFFQAQKALLQLLVHFPANQRIFEKLIELSLDNFEVTDGWKWFNRISGNIPGDTPWKKGYGLADQRRMLLYIRLLADSGKIREALQEAQRYRDGWKERKDQDNEDGEQYNFVKQLGRLYLHQKQYDSCLRLLQEYDWPRTRDVELAVMYEIASSTQKSSEKTNKVAANIAGMGIVKQLEAALLEAEVGEIERGLKRLRKIQKDYPESQRIAYLLMEISSDSAKLLDALQIVEKLSEQYPEEQYYHDRRMQLNFRLGRYTAILDYYSSYDAAVLTIQQKLLLARSLWALEKRKQSVALYKEILNTFASKEFLERISGDPSQRRMMEQEENWSGILNFSESEKLNWLNETLNTDNILKNTGNKEGRILAEFYDRLRWEKIILREYRARKAILERKYIVAEKQYRRAIKEERLTEGLMDLARIYKRLGNYGKEAEVYGVIERQGQKGFDLEKQIERNKLTRAPRLSFNYKQLEKSGREQSIDVREQKAGTGFWFMPELSSEVLLEYAEVSYKPVLVEGMSVRGREINGLANFEIADNTIGYVGAGLHMLDGEGDSVIRYNFGLEHKLDEVIKGYVRYDQDVVNDTMEALEGGLYSRGLTVGMILEAQSGLSIGGEYRNYTYNDNNSQDRLYFWSVYSAFGEFTTLELKYDYEIKKNDEANELTINPETGAASNSLPYWSPQSYWQHRINVHFKHLLTDFKAFEGAPSYYALDFSVGYEADSNIRYTGGFDIFLEMNSDFLLNGNLLYSRTSDYDEKSVFLSLIYRW